MSAMRKMGVYLGLLEDADALSANAVRPVPRPMQSARSRRAVYIVGTRANAVCAVISALSLPWNLPFVSSTTGLPSAHLF